MKKYIQFVPYRFFEKIVNLFIVSYHYYHRYIVSYTCFFATLTLRMFVMCSSLNFVIVTSQEYLEEVLKENAKFKFSSLNLFYFLSLKMTEATF